MLIVIVLLFFFYCFGDHRDLHSFPTRRSSDLSTAPRSSAGPSPHGNVPSGIATAGSSARTEGGDRKSTRLNSSHSSISYAVFCLKKKNRDAPHALPTDQASPRREHTRCLRTQS